MKKGLGNRSQSGIITAILLIVIVIVAIVIVWNIIYAILKNATPGGSSTDVFTTQLEIKKTQLYATGGVMVQVYRKAGEGTLSGLKFIFENKKGERKMILRNENLSELEQRNFIFTSTEIGFNNSDINKILVVPMIGNSNGNEVEENEDAMKRDVNENRVLEIDSNSGLVSWWKFDGNPQDSVGSNHGQLKGDAKTENNVLVLDGTGDYVNVPYNSNFDFTTTYSIIAFVKPSILNSPYKEIVVKDEWAAGKGGYDLRINGAGSPYADSVGNTASTAVTAGTTFLSTTQFSQLAYTYSSGQMALYLNGAQINTTTATILTLAGIADLTIGSSQNGGGSFFNGSIDNVMIFNKALSSSEIQAIYNNQK